MPGIDFNVRTAKRGPMFDGRTAKAMHAYRDEISLRIAEEGEKLIRQRLKVVLQHPTGYYESRISVDRAGDGYRVSDGGVIYGPWLEGTGSRNSPVTRFPGYATFRRTKPLVDKRAREIAVRLLARYKAMGLI
ncbi:hypothetical protein [Streptomyces sp. BK340]|uniref:hypothetical protein n=1 Tax=Streptomyces sp. BK340 TaxID=2572903 RepID=UPI00119E03D1|nr:hypothetical protein [Streptomyces sp. BK340]TVZ96520.1 hypothetical protein FB157_103431 [Streptomyces sp. BK340]